MKILRAKWGFRTIRWWLMRLVFAMPMEEIEIEQAKQHREQGSLL
jgi:hypothetical protein